MKNLRFISFWLLLTVGLATVVFNSCGDDKKEEPKKEQTDPDNGGNNSSSGLVGTWTCTDVQAERTGCGTPSAYKDANYIFKADGTFTRGSSTGKWELENNTLTLTFANGTVYSTTTLTTTKFMYRVYVSLNIPMGACQGMGAYVSYTYEKGMQ
ncbi:hypothetical protein FACS189434_11950 [Bacteroidia bacterium]|nr:hypothetical protein FACS189434_11950 [Bacteroidia bacterium]